MVGDDGAAVHLGASAHHRQHATDRQDAQTGSRVLASEVIGFPRIAVEPRGSGHALGIVAHGAAAHREDEIDVVLAGEFATLIEFLHRRVRHHAAILDNRLAGLL